MSRNAQPKSTGQVSKKDRERRRFWHSLAVAIGEGTKSTETLVSR